MKNLTKEEWIKRLCAEGYSFLGNWNGYKVYSIDYEKGLKTGQLYFLLEKDNKVRLSEEQETYAIVKKFFPND